MRHEVTKVGPKYQVTIPKEVREALGLKVGDLVQAAVGKDKTIVLRRKRLVDFDAELEEALAEAEADYKAGRVLGPFDTAEETVAVFLVRPQTEYGLAFYRNRQVVNYQESGVPDEQHLLVARVSGRGGADMHTQEALQEYLEGRHYEQLFTWPEQGLVVYMVGSR